MASGNKGNSTKGKKRKIQEVVRLQAQRRRDEEKRAKRLAGPGRRV